MSRPDARTLLPCPFCGSSKYVRVSPRSRQYVECIDCAAEGPFASSVSEAIKKWNTRKRADSTSLPVERA